MGERPGVVLGVTIDEQAGRFRRFCRVTDPHCVTELNYCFDDTNRVHMFVGMQVALAEDQAAVTERLFATGSPVVDTTDNETAELHVKNVVGGPAFWAELELLWRLEFPEHLVAQFESLEGLGSHENITLFHCRN